MGFQAFFEALSHFEHFFQAQDKTFSKDLESHLFFKAIFILCFLSYRQIEEKTRRKKKSEKNIEKKCYIFFLR